MSGESSKKHPRLFPWSEDLKPLQKRLIIKPAQWKKKGLLNTIDNEDKFNKYLKKGKQWYFLREFPLNPKDDEKHIIEIYKWNCKDHVFLDVQKCGKWMSEKDLVLCDVYLGEYKIRYKELPPTDPRFNQHFGATSLEGASGTNKQNEHSEEIAKNINPLKGRLFNKYDDTIIDHI